jgi:hypothetical protein
MPDLDRFYRERADKAAILAVAPLSSEGGLRDVLMGKGYQFPLLIDQGDIGYAYNVRYLPALYVIDADGNLVDRRVGGTDFDQLDRLADDLIGG